MKIDQRHNPEIGRKLLAHELKTKTVVVLYRPSGPHVTAWVRGMSSRLVHFYMGVSNVHLLLTPQNDGTLADDTGKEVEVYEYLGKI